MSLVLGGIIDRYVVEAELGRGGMAQVYRIRHRTLGTLHALKVLLVHSDALQARAVQEARVQAAIRHPNVVAVSDVIEVEGAPGLIMDYVAGPNLDGWLAEHALTARQVQELFREIVLGVAAAHEYGLVHRDLKPANILVDETRGRPVPRVTDFGIAKVIDPDLRDAGMTRSGVGMGTPSYMAPEQFRNAKAVDQRADMFSLGCIAYCMAVGHPPYEETDHYVLVSRALAGDYKRPEVFRRDLSPDLVDAINGCLVGPVEGRVASCEELLAILDGQNTPHRPRKAGARSDAGGMSAEVGAPVRAAVTRSLVDRTQRTLHELLGPERASAVITRLADRRVGVGAAVVAALLLGLFLGTGAEEGGQRRHLPAPEAPPVVPPVAPAPSPEPATPSADEAFVTAEPAEGLMAVYLVSASNGRRHPIEGTVTLPVGSYKIEAEFADVGKMYAGLLTLDGGQRVGITCSPRLLMCRRSG